MCVYVSTTANKWTACLFQITGMQSSREIKLQQPCDTSVTHSHDKRFTSDYAKGTPKHTPLQRYFRDASTGLTLLTPNKYMWSQRGHDCVAYVRLFAGFA